MSVHAQAEPDPQTGAGPADAVVIEGFVEHGDERGRRLGFPTANLHDVSAVGLDGVYAATFQIDPANDGPRYVAAVSVGRRPTYYGRHGVRLLEAHVLDFHGDLYGRRVRVELPDSSVLEGLAARHWCGSCAWTSRRRGPGR